MKFWIVNYYTRFGNNCFPMFQNERPTETEALSDFDPNSLELDRDDEGVEIFGPFDTPEVK